MLSFCLCFDIKSETLCAILIWNIHQKNKLTTRTFFILLAINKDVKSDTFVTQTHLFIKILLHLYQYFRKNHILVLMDKKCNSINISKIWCTINVFYSMWMTWYKCNTDISINKEKLRLYSFYVRIFTKHAKSTSLIILWFTW